MQHYKEYYPKIKKQQLFFEKLIDKIKNETNFHKALDIAVFALSYAAGHNTGYFTSSFLEDFFVRYSKSLSLPACQNDYKKNSFLHVLTTGYNVGGHTRVVERWIDYASSGESHSVVIIKPEEKLEGIERAVNDKGGECIYFEPGLSLKGKALKLRQLGLNYEYIILHTHMEDPTATVAFGTDDFKRPVIFYNHASHLFWIGRGACDIVVDLIKNDEITLRRGIKGAFYLGIPTKEFQIQNKNKIEARKKLGLPVDKKIILTSASAHKYSPIGDDNFYDLIKDVIDNDTYLYVIGPSLKNPLWKKYNKKSCGHIIPLGPINFDKGYLDYLAAGDLYIDSFPMCSWTAGMDAVSRNTPIIGFYPVFSSPDYLKITDGYTTDKNIFIKRAKKLLTDENYRSKLLQEEQKSMLSMQAKEAWQSRVNEFLTVVPKIHKIKTFEVKNDYNKIDDYCVLVNATLDKNFFKSPLVYKFIPTIKYTLYKYILHNKKKMYKYFAVINS